MKRQHQLLLIAATLGFSWLAMQVVHESGHVLAAWATGGRIAEVKLHPAALSYTQLAENPRPRIVAWMGPLVGVAAPLLAWSLARAMRLRGWYVLQFFAGFCLVANGAYLAGGALYDIGDASELVRQGASQLVICLGWLPAIVLGLWLWNGLGVQFGFGSADGHIDKFVAFVVLLLLAVTVLLELLFS